MNEADMARLAEIDAGLAGRTQYEGREERSDEFLRRLLREQTERAEKAEDANADNANALLREIERLKGRGETVNAEGLNPVHSVGSTPTVPTITEALSRENAALRDALLWLRGVYDLETSLPLESYSDSAVHLLTIEQAMGSSDV